MPCFNCMATKLLSDPCFLGGFLVFFLAPVEASFSHNHLGFPLTPEGSVEEFPGIIPPSYFSVAHNWWHPLLHLATTRADTRPLK